MREEIAYQEMKEEMAREQEGQQSADPTTKDQQSAARAGATDPTKKSEPPEGGAPARQAD